MDHRASTPTHYAVLGVSTSASAAQIKRAFRKRALRAHPDTAPERANAHEEFLALRRAYDALSDPARRRAYDAGLRGDAGPPLGMQARDHDRVVRGELSSVYLTILAFGCLVPLIVLALGWDPWFTPKAVFIFVVTPFAWYYTATVLSARLELDGGGVRFQNKLRGIDRYLLWEEVTGITERVSARGQRATVIHGTGRGEFVITGAEYGNAEELVAVARERVRAAGARAGRGAPP